MSGLDQKTYEINHVGGRLDYVLANLHRIGAIRDRHRLDLHIRVKQIKFPYNAHQEPQFLKFANDNGFEFEVIDGVGNPIEYTLAPYDDAYFQKEIGKAAEMETSLEDRREECALLFDQIALDCRGDVYLCCAVPNYDRYSKRIG